MQRFEEFYAATQPRLLRAVYAVTGDVAEAQDCVQEAFVRAASRWPLDRLDSPEAWVRRVALNLALDGHRRRVVRWRFAQRARPPEPAAAPGTDGLDVVRAVRTLPREEQEVVVRHHLLDMSVAATAHDLDRPEGTVKAQLVRARARLAALLALDEELSRD